jgi:hypothetical protein
MATSHKSLKRLYDSSLTPDISSEIYTRLQSHSHNSKRSGISACRSGLALVGTDGRNRVAPILFSLRAADGPSKERDCFIRVDRGGSRSSGSGRDGEEGIRLRCRDTGGLQSGIQSILWRKCNTRFVERLKGPRVGSLMSCPAPLLLLFGFVRRIKREQVGVIRKAPAPVSGWRCGAV